MLRHPTSRNFRLILHLVTALLIYLLAYSVTLVKTSVDKYVYWGILHLWYSYYVAWHLQWHRIYLFQNRSLETYFTITGYICIVLPPNRLHVKHGSITQWWNEWNWKTWLWHLSSFINCTIVVLVNKQFLEYSRLVEKWLFAVFPKCLRVSTYNL